jgi:predicted AAA+ superfamily ATPase
MYPLSFIEFLSALGHSSLIEPLLKYECKRPLSEVVHKRLLGLCGKYMALGGLPEVVETWVTLGDPKKCFEVQNDLILMYQKNFEKYSKKHQEKYLNVLFLQIPHFVGQQFQYKNIPGEYRKQELPRVWIF